MYMCTTKIKLSDCFKDSNEFGCSSAVEHIPAAQNSGGHGFKSCRSLGLIHLYLISSVSLIQVPHRGATPLILLLKKGEANLIRTD